MTLLKFNSNLNKMLILVKFPDKNFARNFHKNFTKLLQKFHKIFKIVPPKESFRSFSDKSTFNFAAAPFIPFENNLTKVMIF